MLRYPPSMPLKASRLDIREGNVEPTRASVQSLTRRDGDSDGDPAPGRSPNLDVGRASAETAVIIIILTIISLLLFILFILYKKKGADVINPLAWWRSFHDKAATSAADDSNPATARGATLDAESSSGNVHDEKLNDSQRNLAQAGDIDIEKGWARDDPDERPPEVDQTLRPPNSATGRSVHTQSSMALNPQLDFITRDMAPQNDDTFSGSTAEPTHAAPVHVSREENPLPPLPFESRNSARDTMLTTISEDLQPTRHRNINSWVSNMQTRQERREIHQQGPGAWPEPIPEEPHAHGPTGLGHSAQLSELSGESDMKTPSLKTAQMAWPVRQGTRKIQVAHGSGSGERSDPRQAVENGSQEQDRYRQEQPDDHPQDESNPFETDDADEGTLPDTRYEPDSLYPQAEPEQEDHDQADPYEYDQQQEQHHQQQLEADHVQDDPQPEINVQSPSLASTIPEDEWLPPVTRYKYASGSTLSRSSSTATAREPAPAPAPAPAAAAEARKRPAGPNSKPRNRDASAQRSSKKKSTRGGKR